MLLFLGYPLVCLCVCVLVNTIFHKLPGEFHQIYSLSTLGRMMNCLILRLHVEVINWPNMAKSLLLGPFCHHRTLNDVSLNWYGCIITNLVRKTEAYTSSPPVELCLVLMCNVRVDTRKVDTSVSFSGSNELIKFGIYCDVLRVTMFLLDLQSRLDLFAAWRERSWLYCPSEGGATLAWRN